MKRFRKKIILFSIFYIIFLHYGHATKEIIELKIPKTQHSLFDPLDKSLQAFKIQLMLWPDGYALRQLTDYYNTIENYDEIIELGQGQSDDVVDEISNNSFTAILLSNKNKKWPGKFVKNGKEPDKDIARVFTTQNIPDNFFPDYINWQLDYLNNLRNQPAATNYCFCYNTGIFHNSCCNYISIKTLQKSINLFVKIQLTDQITFENLKAKTNLALITDSNKSILFACTDVNSCPATINLMRTG